jgi:hypothetical protein
MRFAKRTRWRVTLVVVVSTATAILAWQGEGNKASSATEAAPDGATQQPTGKPPPIYGSHRRGPSDLERAPTHDLIRLREPIALTVDAPVPSWVEPVLRRTPWVVARRGYVHEKARLSAHPSCWSQIRVGNACVGPSRARLAAGKLHLDDSALSPGAARSAAPAVLSGC